MTYWHYTTKLRLESIINDGTIYPSKEWEDNPVMKAGRPLVIKPAVYLSTESVFEYACLKPVVLDDVFTLISVEAFNREYGVVRIKVCPVRNKVLTWNKLYKAQGVPKRDNAMLVSGSIGLKSNPSKHWFGVIGAVRLSEAEAYEFDGDKGWNLMNTKIKVK